MRDAFAAEVEAAAATDERVVLLSGDIGNRMFNSFRSRWPTRFYNCGVAEAKLRDHAKNPTGQHRCWASINNKDDQLYKVSRELFQSQAVVFFVSPEEHS